MPAWVAKGKIGTLLLASEMLVPIPPSRTVSAYAVRGAIKGAITISSWVGGGMSRRRRRRRRRSLFRLVHSGGAIPNEVGGMSRRVVVGGGKSFHHSREGIHLSKYPIDIFLDCFQDH